MPTDEFPEQDPIAVSIAQQLVSLAEGQLGSSDSDSWEVQECSRSDSDFIVVAAVGPGGQRRCYRVSVTCDEEQ